MSRAQTNSIPTNGERTGTAAVATTTDALPRWLWNAGEVAAVLGVTEDCVKNLHRTYSLRGVLVGRNLRWRPRDVERYVQGLKPGEDLDGEVAD